LVKGFLLHASKNMPGVRRLVPLSPPVARELTLRCLRREGTNALMCRGSGVSAGSPSPFVGAPHVCGAGARCRVWSLE
jgi:hypothetical protein